MDIKETIYNIVISNLNDPRIRQLYDKAISISCPIEKQPSIIYIKVYSYNTFCRYINTMVTKEQYSLITGDRSFYIPVRSRSNQYSIVFEVETTQGDKTYVEDCLTSEPDLTIFNKLMSYEREMLDGSTPGQDDQETTSQDV